MGCSPSRTNDVTVNTRPDSEKASRKSSVRSFIDPYKTDHGGKQEDTSATRSSGVKHNTTQTVLDGHDNINTIVAPANDDIKRKKIMKKNINSPGPSMQTENTTNDINQRSSQLNPISLRKQNSANGVDNPEVSTENSGCMKKRAKLDLNANKSSIGTDMDRSNSVGDKRFPDNANEIKHVKSSSYKANSRANAPGTEDNEIIEDNHFATGGKNGCSSLMKRSAHRENANGTYCEGNISLIKQSTSNTTVDSDFTPTHVSGATEEVVLADTNAVYQVDNGVINTNRDDPKYFGNMSIKGSVPEDNFEHNQYGGGSSAEGSETIDFKSMFDPQSYDLEALQYIGNMTVSDMDTIHLLIGDEKENRNKTER